MSNSACTTLKCSNAEVVKKCIEAMNNNETPFLKDTIACEDGGTVCHAVTAWDYPCEKIKAVSREFPNDVITCRYSNEGDWYSQIHIVEYRNGNEKIVDIEPGYTSGHIPLIDEKDRDAIIKKATAYCRKLDTTRTDNDGKMFIDWFKEKVCFTFEHDGADGKKYRVEATKNLHDLGFKIFEGHVKHDWREITNEFLTAHELPF